MLLTERKRNVSLAQTSRAMVKNAKSRFVGAADADIRQYVHLQMDVALDHPGRSTKDDELATYTEIAFEEAVQAGAEWAVALKNSYRDNVVKPLVDKARAAGVDPFPVVAVETKLGQDEARALIKELDDAANGPDSLEEFDSDDLDEQSAAYNTAVTAA